MLHPQYAPARRKRMMIQGIALLATLILCITLWFAQNQHQALKHSSYMLGQIQRDADQVRSLELGFVRWQAFRHQEQRISQEIAAGKLNPQHWQVRALTVEQAELPRWKVQAYLTSLQKQSGYMFLPERFELKALFDGDDLFRWQPNSSNRLELTLVGDYFLRRQP